MEQDIENLAYYVDAHALTNARTRALTRTQTYTQKRGKVQNNQG